MPDGESDGETDGETEGEALGDALGEALGDTLGDSLGDAVGDAVGEAVGDAVGEAVGTSVGDAVILVCSCKYRVQYSASLSIGSATLLAPRIVLSARDPGRLTARVSSRLTRGNLIVLGYSTCSSLKWVQVGIWRRREQPGRYRLYPQHAKSLQHEVAPKSVRSE